MATWRASGDWRRFSSTLADDSFLDGNLLAEPLDRILALQFLKLDWSVLVQELVNGEVAAANTNLYVVLFDLDSNSLCAKLVDALGLTHEHDLEFLTFGVVVDEFSQFAINLVLLDRDVDSNALLQVHDVLL